MSIDDKALEVAAKRWHKVLLGNNAVEWENCSDHWRQDCLKQTRSAIEAYEAAKVADVQSLNTSTERVQKVPETEHSDDYFWKEAFKAKTAWTDTNGVVITDGSNYTMFKAGWDARAPKWEISKDWLQHKPFGIAAYSESQNMIYERGWDDALKYAGMKIDEIEGERK